MTRTALLISVALIILSCGQNHDNSNSEKINQDSVVYLNRAIGFIKEVMPQETLDSSFILTDKPFNFEYFNCFEELLSDTFTFSKSELQFIKLRQFYSISSWTKEIFPKIKLINSGIVDSIFKDNSKGWNNFYKTIGREYHSFSFPIFLRDYKYCLFYEDNSCGWLCGMGSLKLYEYDGKKWVEKKSYCNWIS